jgi:hypothetical protein
MSSARKSGSTGRYEQDQEWHEENNDFTCM